MDTTLLGLLAFGVFGALCIFFGLRKPRPGEQAKPQSKKQDDASEMIDHANEVVAAYGAALEQTSQLGPSGIAFHSKSRLPYSKNEIRKSIELLLLVALDEADRNHLRAANIFLNDFISDEEYQAIQEQQGDFAKAIEAGKAGDVKTMAALLNSGTLASKLLTKQIPERIIQECNATIERHQALELAAAKLPTSRS